MRPTRLLIVDDSVVIRRVLTRVLEADGRVEVVGTASNGVLAIDAIERLRPDVVTLDVALPELDGLGVLRELGARRIRVPVIMFSMLTERGGRATLEALSLGAADYVTKPTSTGGFDEAAEQVREQLLPKLRALTATGGELARCRPALPARAVALESVRELRDASRGRVAPAPRPSAGERPGLVRPIDAIVIGVSTGGPNALQVVVPQLDVDVPVAIVQHMPAMFTRLLAERLDERSRLRVVEGADGMLLRAGECAIAPGDFHMTVHAEPDGLTVRTSKAPPEQCCRPAADLLFRSAAAAVGGRCLAVVMTGMGRDGAAGARELAAAGARIFVQDEATSVVWGMPGTVAGLGIADRELPLEGLAPAINEAVRAGRSARLRGA